MKKFNKSEVKKVESLIADFGFEFDLISDESGNQIYYLKKSDLEELKGFVEENKADYGFIDLENFQKKTQVHIARDKDIKLDMVKLNDYNIKLIYHRKSDGQKEYRIFISYKDADKKLVRKRYINDDIKKIHSDEKKMLEFFGQIKEAQIKDYINR